MWANNVNVGMYLFKYFPYHGREYTHGIVSRYSMLALWLEAQPSLPHLPSLCQLELPGGGLGFSHSSLRHAGPKVGTRFGQSKPSFVPPPPQPRLSTTNFDGSKKENEWKQRRSPQKRRRFAPPFHARPIHPLPQ